MGKVSEEDFAESKKTLSVELATILKEIQRQERA